MRPDRIIEKRQNWQDYLDPMEDDDELLLDEEGIGEMDVEEENQEE